MTDLIKIAEGYISAWNESDADRRAELLKAAFTEDVSYRDPLMQGDGHAGVAALIDGVQQRFAGFRFSLKAMWPEVSQLNLRKLAPTLQVPVFFLLGRKDHWVPPETSVAYFDTLAAPAKRVVWFERAGHEVFVDEADAFNATMAQLVRPAIA